MWKFTGLILDNMFKYYKDIYEGDIALIQYVPPNWQRFTALLRYMRQDRRINLWWNPV